jgi:alkaline phosphatase D
MMTRREAILAAAAYGAALAWPAVLARPTPRWRERRDLYPEGVASGDPESDGVILWTRRPPSPEGAASRLTLEIAETAGFERPVSTAVATVSAATDWTCRVLAAGLSPSRVYWYRFTDEHGFGSRIGRTRTAPAADDPRPVRFAFVSCQNVCEGAQNAYRRMAFEDERAAAGDQLWFVLHLGDFVYEVVDYPEDFPGGHRYDRRIRPAVRYPQGEKIRAGFHIPVTLEDYRTLYRAYLHDPDLQDARARWPFVSMWDNHEFSWLGWQSLQQFDGVNRPAQTRKVMANQAWFEYQPARVAGAAGAVERFEPPAVRDAPIERFDESGLGQEPGNLAAIRSLTGYRALRLGRNAEILITDQHSYRSEEPSGRKEAESLSSRDFPEMVPEEVMQALDGGRAYAGGRPPGTLSFGAAQVPNFRKDEPPQTILGAEQKAWFLSRLRASKATWKVWGNSLGTLDWRADPQNLPAGLGAKWPGAGYACFGGGGDYGTAYAERAEIYDAVREAGITGFVTVSGDRHSFWAGLAAKALPPAAFEPVGVAFITGSISAPGLVEAYEHRFPKDHPLRALYVADVGGEKRPAVNLLMHHGVRACLEYQRSGDAAAARRASNPDLAPHLSFLDMGGHGYAVLRVSADAVECEFVCIPRPLERSAGEDGGPLRYRVAHRVPIWRKGERPKLEPRVIDGDPGLSI